MGQITAGTSVMAAGGGAFALPRLTLGIFLNDQPSHRLAVGSDRRKALPLARDGGWILPAGSAGFCEFDAALHVTLLSFEGPLLRDMDLAADDPALQRVGPIDPLTLHLARTLVAEGEGGRLYRDTMELALAAHLAQGLRAAPPEAARIDDPRLRRAVSYVQDNLDRDLSLDDLAGVAAMSAFHFARAFKTALGLSPLQFVIAARIDRAKVLLRTLPVPVAEVAHRVGYADVSRFAQHFKRQVGTTPGAYRAG